MPWIYKIAEGKLYLLEGAALTRVGQGYSGDVEHKNDPASTHLQDQGPIPPGVYIVGPARDLQGGPHGPFVLPLQPMSVNEMYGRSGFLLHGDSVSQPGTASSGCIIMPRPVRDKIAASTDKTLVVLA